MEIIRSDDYHADSCWITWGHPDTGMKVTTYPMMHIAGAGYYQHIAQEIQRCEYVLLEGVTWSRSNKKRHLYDLAARNLRLAAQEDALQYPARCKKINLDMPRPEFRKLVFHLPVRYVLMLLFLRPLLWAMTLPPSFRRRAIKYGLLRRRRWQDRPDDSPLTSLVLGGRDKRILENLGKFYRESGACEQITFSAIVFGAAHMPALYGGLRRLGFRPGSRRWVEMLRVPAGDDGTAGRTPPPTVRTRR